ncbi:hypothetical protein [Streptomyces sp. NPDC051162]|uniref:hypothetical protein n=1 Tax=Streptomyces sp. NPDC051162 TaxID=3154747 RepID=UPI0034438839
MRIPRFRNLAIPLLGALTTLMVTAGAAAADDKKYDKYKPAGIGDLLRTPSIGQGGGHTLYEQFGAALYYRLDSELGWKDIGWSMLNGMAELFMGLTVFVTQSAVVAVQWTMDLTKVQDIHDAIIKSISGAAGTVSATLLPSALAVGAMVAWANHRKASGSGLSQLGWVAASGILAVSLISTPQVWVDGIDSVREVGASIAAEATSAGMDRDVKEPFEVKGDANLGQTEDDGKPKTDPNEQKKAEESKKNKLVRKSSDAIWRSYVVTPWCIAEFGNLNTCKQYGEETLRRTDKKPDDDDFDDARKEYLSKDLSDSDVGVPAMKWRQGKNAGRVTVAIAAFICAVLFAVLAIALAFASLASLIGALMLLLAGVVFACLWVIPGRPRQWGMRWFDALLGFAMQSFVSTMVLGVVLVLNTVSITMLGTYGYFASAGVSITSAIVAFKFRSVMESIVGVSGSLTPGGSALGMAMGRGASRMAGRATGWTAGKAARGTGWAGKQAGRAAATGARKGAKAFDEKVSHVGKAMAMSSWAATNSTVPLGVRGGAKSKDGSDRSGADERAMGSDGPRASGGVTRAGAYRKGAGTAVDLPERRTTTVASMQSKSATVAAHRGRARTQSTQNTEKSQNSQSARNGSAQAGQAKSASSRRNPSSSKPGNGQDVHTFRQGPKLSQASRQQRINGLRREQTTAQRTGSSGGKKRPPSSGGSTAARTPAPNRRRGRNK